MSTTFVELIRQKEGLLQRLVSASIRQLEIVRDENMSLLLELLAQKQRLMNEFETIERKLVPFRDIPPEERRWKDEEERRKTVEAMEHCAEMLREILRNDESSTGELAEKKSEVELQIRRIRQSTKVNATYAKQAPEGNFLRFEIDS